MKYEIQVSVLCLVYNHEKYIRKCLEGFVNQKTNFKYEVLIHDDASTDDSAKIIKEYEKKYPDIIKPIYQKENQYSKRRRIMNTILFPKTKGKYIALCEGDDYWNDNLKLQKQYDIMEEHPECSMCVHNTIRHDLLGHKKDVLFCNSKKQHFFTDEEVFMGWNVHTSSYFIRKNIFLPPEYSWKYWFGDYVRLVTGYSKGKIIYLPDTMSVYNYNNMGGVTFKNYILDIDKGINKIKMRKDFLLEFNKETNEKYNKIILERISQVDFEILLRNIDKKLTYSEYMKLRNKIFKDDFLEKFLSKQNALQKIKFNLKYRCYVIYKLRIIRRNYYAKKNSSNTVFNTRNK